MSIDEHFDAEDYLEGDEEETRCFFNDAINDGYYQCEQGIESCQIAKDMLDEYVERVKDALDEKVQEWEELKEKISNMEYEI